MTISGVTIGRSRSTSIGAAPALPDPRQPEPEQRPERDRRDDRDAATWSVTPRAPRISSFENSVGYQSRVKPAQLKFRLSALKLKMIRMTIGRNRKT